MPSIRIDGPLHQTAVRFALFAASCLLLVYVSTEDIRPKLASGAGGQSTFSQPAASTSVVATAQVTSAAALLVHPVFEPTRLPWLAPRPDIGPRSSLPVAVHPAKPQGYIVVGLVVSKFENEALVQGPGGKMLALKQGQELAGWMITRIDAAGLHLTANSDVALLKMGRAQDTQSIRPRYGFR